MFVICSLLIGCATEISGLFCEKNTVVRAWLRGVGVTTNVGVRFAVTGQKRLGNTVLYVANGDTASQWQSVQW